MSKLSKPVIELLMKLGFTNRKLPDIFKSKIEGSLEAQKDDFEYTLTTDNSNYINKNLERVSIKDVVGTLSNKDSKPLIEYVSELCTETYEYGRRSLRHLNVSIPDNIQNINKTNVAVAIKVIKIKNKYYVNGDGNHRTFYLLLMYYAQLENNKNNPKLLQEIEDKYKINMVVSKVSEYKIINKICYCLIKTDNRNVQMAFTFDDRYIGILQINKEKYLISSEEQFVEYFSNYLNTLDKNDSKYQLLVYWLLKLDYFDERIVKKINNFDEDFVIAETIQKNIT